MELTKKVYIDQIEVLPLAGVIQYRVRKSICEDNTEVSYTWWRHCVLSEEAVAEIMQIAEAHIND